MTKICRVCGILKDIQLFSPCYMKANSAICRKCAKEDSDRRRIKNNVPADAGFRFDDKHPGKRAM